MVKVKEFIESLKGLDGESELLLACDEEQNVLYKDVRAIEYAENKEVVLFGCSGSEVED